MLPADTAFPNAVKSIYLTRLFEEGATTVLTAFDRGLNDGAVFVAYPEWEAVESTRFEVFAQGVTLAGIVGRQYRMVGVAITGTCRLSEEHPRLSHPPARALGPFSCSDLQLLLGIADT